MVSFSVLIISNGRDDLLLKCLESLKPQVDNWQLIIVANGTALPESVSLKAKSLTSDVELVLLPEIQSSGAARNQGIQQVKHDWVLLLDEAAYAYPNYFEVVFPLLAQERVGILGGIDLPAKNLNPVSESFALTLASPFCTGPTYSRHQSKGKKLILATEEDVTDSHLWFRTHYLKETLFSEKVQNKDLIKMLITLRNQGAHIYYHPGLVMGFHRSPKLKTLGHQTFISGYSRSQLMKEMAYKYSGLYWLPAFFVLLHLLILTKSIFFWDMARIYGAVVIMMSLNLAARKKKIGLFPHITFMHYFIVFLYGAGYSAHRLGLKVKR